MADTLNYSNSDFENIKENLITLLSQKENIAQDINFAGSNINAMIELGASTGDLLNFYINMSADEQFILTAELYGSVNKLVEVGGYKPNGYKSASVTLSLTSNDIFGDASLKDGYKITIPKYSRFTSDVQTPEEEDIFFTNINQLVYVIDSTTVSVSGTISFDVPLTQGNPTDIGSELEFISDGGKFQTYELTDLKAIEENMIVTVGDEEWTSAKNLFRGIDEDSKVFTTRYNKNQKVEIRFGDGIFGKIPPVNDSIKIRYISSLGSDGNVSANVISGITSEITITDTVGVSTSLSPTSFDFSQVESAVGGSNPDDTETVRQYGPAYVRTQERTVTTSDYEDLVLSEFSEVVLKAKAFKYEELFDNTDKLSDKLTTGQIDSLSVTLSGFGLSTLDVNNLLYSPITINQSIFYNNIYVVAIPKFGTVLTQNLKTQLEEFLEDYKMTTINHVFLDPTYVDINTTTTYVRDTSSSKTTSEIEIEINSVIAEFFDKQNRSIGELIKHSEIVNSLHDITGISAVIFEIWKDGAVDPETNQNIQMGSLEFPLLNTSTIVAG
jgi:hypothetical protein